MNTATETVRADGPVLQGCLDILHERIGSQKFNAWFRHGTRIGIEVEHIKVTVPNPFVANWIESHYQADIAAAVQERTGDIKPVVISIDPGLSGQLRRHQLDTQADIVAMAGSGRSRPRHQPAPVSLKHKLSDFVVGPSNKLAHSAAVAVAGGSKAAFNPLFIHGPCGVGKTHLLQGICNQAGHVLRDGRPTAWRYVTGEQFTNDFVQSLRQKKLNEFRARYRGLDLLAIDDVHFLAGKKATQEEFLHTFNAIASAGKMVVMASDAHPKMVGELNEQLVSRFAAGMVVKIETPDQATRVEILRRRAAAMKQDVPADVLSYIAMHIRGSVRELEGALIKLVAVAALENKPISLQLANDSLSEHLARTGSAVTLGDIEAGVAAFFGITPADLHSSRRTRTVSGARMIVMFLARRHTSMSYPEIGQFLGKNHSSVVLGVQRLEALLKKNGDLAWLTPMGVKALPAREVVELLGGQFP